VLRTLLRAFRQVFTASAASILRLRLTFLNYLLEHLIFPIRLLKLLH